MAAQATLVSVIAAKAVEIVVAADELATNVHAIDRAPDRGEDVSSVRELWGAVKRKPPVYALAPFDPLRQLVEAWSARLVGTTDDLELMIGLTTGVEIPDFYLVDERTPAPAGAWYFEMLYSEAPRRVHAFDGTAQGVIRELRALRAGPELPSAGRIGERARSFIPGTVGLRTATVGTDRSQRAAPAGQRSAE